MASTGAGGAGFCDACFTGDYPVEVPVGLRKAVLEEPTDGPPASSNASSPASLSGAGVLGVGGTGG